MTGRFAGQVVLITGGGGTLGSAYAHAFAAEGASVVLLDLDAAAMQTVTADILDGGGTVLPIECNVAVRASCQDAVAAILERFGRIDILVNNAGYATQQDWDALPESELDRVFDANLKGCFFMAQAVTPAMRSQGRGKIVNVTSAVFFLGPPRLVHYVAAKSAVIGFTRALARAVGSYGITVNAFAPGMTASRATLPTNAQDYFDYHASRRAISRWEYPEDLVGSVLFLSSPDSDFVSGQTIVIDGGMVMH